MIMQRTMHIKASNRPGFSLIETVISLTIVSVLFLGLSAAVMISAYAIPSGSETGDTDREVIDALNMLRTDLRQAASITQRDGATGTRLTITPKTTKVAGQPTQIRYDYVSADLTLTRTTDNAGDQLLTDNIGGLALSFKQDGSNAISAYLLISVKNTIQPIYEVNAVLPNRPEYIP